MPSTVNISTLLTDPVGPASNPPQLFFFFFNDTATTEIYTLSLHDALPICRVGAGAEACAGRSGRSVGWVSDVDRKSTRLNSSHQIISYAVFCLKKKKKIRDRTKMRKFMTTK